MTSSKKSHILELDQERKGLQLKLTELTRQLKELNTNLTDPLVIDGFPRSDLDLYAVREARQAYRVTQNDLYAIDKRIEQLLPLAFAEQHSTTDNTPTRTRDAPIATSDKDMDAVASVVEDPVCHKVVLKVNGIDPESPAYLDGLRRQDLIVQFDNNKVECIDGVYKSGSIEIGDKNNVLQYFSKCIQQDKAIVVKVKRQDSMIDVVIIPRQWEGQGLLGCHLSVEIE